MAYNKYDNYPSLKMPGVYPETGSNITVEDGIKLLGLDNDNLKQLSLGNWNSIVSDAKVITTNTGRLHQNLKGREVYVESVNRTNMDDWKSNNTGLSSITYSKDGDGDIIVGSIVELGRWRPTLPTIPTPNSQGEYTPAQNEDIRLANIEWWNYHLSIFQAWYTSSIEYPEGNYDPDESEPIDPNWPSPQFISQSVGSRILNSTSAFIKERVDEETAPLVFEFDSGDVELTYEKDLGDDKYELFFPSSFIFKSPDTDSSHTVGNMTRPPNASNSGFWELDMAAASSASAAHLVSLGAPHFTYNIQILQILPNLGLVPETYFSVNAKSENGKRHFLYYRGIDDASLIDTTYPVKVELNLNLYDPPDDFDNGLTHMDENATYDIFYKNPDSITDADIIESQILPISSSAYLVNNNHFTYQVIQWGDEKSLLSDEQIKESYFFNLYDMEDSPEDDNYNLKKFILSEVEYSQPIEESVYHTYNDPGVKSIKIIVCKYDKRKFFLYQTYLVTKNIVINDGNLLSQDFSIFGGTDFNFLPMKTFYEHHVDERQFTGQVQYVVTSGEINQKSSFVISSYDGFFIQPLSGYSINITDNNTNTISTTISGSWTNAYTGDTTIIVNSGFSSGIYMGEYPFTMSYDQDVAVEIPLQATIGGLDEDSKYNNSVERIKKDDNFIQDDYLERASSRDFIDNFNKGLYGETPGQLDLSITRMYKKPLDIYDFITNDKQSIVDNNFNINTLPINSSATDIFISNEDCIVDLNPQDIEYLSIQNKTGIPDKAILIGDYKVNQPKDGKVQRQGVMQTPLLEQNTDKQAF